jgi:hypothetical protein
VPKGTFAISTVLLLIGLLLAGHGYKRMEYSDDSPELPDVLVVHFRPYLNEGITIAILAGIIAMATFWSAIVRIPEPCSGEEQESVPASSNQSMDPVFSLSLPIVSARTNE